MASSNGVLITLRFVAAIALAAATMKDKLRTGRARSVVLDELVHKPSHELRDLGLERSTHRGQSGAADWYR